MKSIKIRYSVLGACILFSGCTSMEAVQKYANYTQSTIESVKPVAQDFQASCMRANSSKPFKNHSECSTEKKASKAILMISNVLADYGTALGALAADELVNYDDDINGLTKEINNLNVKGVGSAKVGAVGSLATFVAKAATSAYQQKQVKKFLEESNDSVVSVANTLSDIINHNYSEAIRLEMTAWEASYKQVEKMAQKDKPLEWGIYSKVQWKSRVKLEEKLKIAKNLSKSIKKIGSTHAQLKADSDNLTSKEVAAIVQSFINDAKPVIKEINKTFTE